MLIKDNTVLLLDNDDDDAVNPLFNQVSKIFLIENKVYVILRTLKTVLYNEGLEAFKLGTTDKLRLKKIEPKGALVIIPAITINKKTLFAEL